MEQKFRALSIFLLLCMLFTARSLSAETASCTLTYAQPSTKWMGSLPLGNGRLGAMVYGGIGQETIALNEITLWSGQPDPECNNLCGPDKLREMRDAFLAGDLEKGNQLGWQSLCGHGKSFGTHLPFGDLVITGLEDSDTKATNYLRSLSLDEAIARVTYSYNNIQFKREYFTSNPDQTLVVRYTASRKKAITAKVSLCMLRHSTVSTHVVNNRCANLVVDGDARFDKNGEGGVNFRGAVRVITEGGTIITTDDAITVTAANAMTIVCDIRTDFHNPDYRVLCDKTVEQAASKTYTQLKADHVADYQPLFRRMSISLGTDVNASTEELIAEARKGRPSPAFDALFFQYGRYMQIASSRENSPLPSNLQGVWNDNLACNMPWTCDYHLDINIQQNYWSSNVANLAECNTPLFGYMALLAKYGSETARKVYGCRGWVAHTINNVWGDTAPGNSVGWAMNVTAGAWMMTHLWTHYEYTLDKEYLLHTAYPLLKETALFFMDYMVEDPQTGWLLSGPSISPENSFRTVDGHDYSLSMMPTIDRAVIYDIYNACIQSCRILGIDEDFRSQLERDIKRLPPLMLNADGELREWLVEGSRRSDPSHRHASHLLALYPYGQISPRRTPDLAKGCANFLHNQTSHPGWEDTEWTRGNNINFYARLLNADKAYESLTGLYRVFMRENLMTVSPAGVAGAQEDIFSFDANEAAVAGICEMLLQSYDGCIDFLPALPHTWKDGSISGICARGGIEADFTWKDQQVTSATLRSRISQTVTVRINGQTKQVHLIANQPGNVDL